MVKTSVHQLHQHGQSSWLDFIDRGIMASGELKRLVEEMGIRGVTSNPAIFEKAITSSNDYKDDINRLSGHDLSEEDIFYQMAVEDIRRAADILTPLYEETGGADGYVSLEVSPHLANNTEATAGQAFELWKSLRRPNAMIKIPGTTAALTAIRRATREGINTNVTLLFDINRYEDITDAYLSGLEDRLKNGQPIDHVAAVASFFLSRIDVLIDPILEKKGLGQLKGMVAIAAAKKAYAIYQRVFSGSRFKKLEEKGARPQRLLWASTGSKDPSFSDVKYVEALVGENTVNTLTMDTLLAFIDHGKVKDTLQQGLQKAEQVFEQVKAAGISMEALASQLETAGIQKFIQAYDQLLKAIAQQQKKVKA